ncbi:hypothetical protein HDE76_000033 [Rhodanobacter sp. ANJX3]|nr:hypothetical protein [Rhodanobacter sp. ANJX3]
MARVTWNPKGSTNSKNLSPIAWSCLVSMREDGTFETDFKGETGFQMMKAAMETLRAIDRVRRESAYDFGAG